LRLAAVWQELAQSPLRCTQSGELFKRDQDRLAGNTVLNAAPADNLAELPEPALLAVALGEALGIVTADQSEFRADNLPPEWDEGLNSVLLSIWSALPRLDSW